MHHTYIHVLAIKPYDAMGYKSWYMFHYKLYIQLMIFNYSSKWILLCARMDTRTAAQSVLSFCFDCFVSLCPFAVTIWKMNENTKFNSIEREKKTYTQKQQHSKNSHTYMWQHQTVQVSTTYHWLIKYPILLMASSMWTKFCQRSIREHSIDRQNQCQSHSQSPILSFSHLI